MPTLKFFDVVGKKTFESDDYKIVIRGKRKFAVAKAPSGKDSYRIVSKDFK